VTGHFVSPIPTASRSNHHHHTTSQTPCPARPCLRRVEILISASSWSMKASTTAACVRRPPGNALCGMATAKNPRPPPPARMLSAPQTAHDAPELTRRELGQGRNGDRYEQQGIDAYLVCTEALTITEPAGSPNATAPSIEANSRIICEEQLALSYLRRSTESALGGQRGRQRRRRQLTLFYPY
jgi:hypothetical protein